MTMISKLILSELRVLGKNNPSAGRSVPKGSWKI